MRSQSPRAAAHGAAGLGGALYFLGWVGFGWWPLIGCFLVPLWWGLERLRARGLVEAAAGGALFGAVAFVGGHAWLWRLVRVFLGDSAALGALLALVYGAGFALGFAAYAACFALLRRRGRSLAVAGVAPLVVLEWLSPLIFPAHAGAALVDLPLFVQLADLGGPLLLTALVGVVNVALFETLAWLAGARRRPLRVWAAAAAVLVAAAGYGALRTASLSRALAAAPELRVGVVQANLGPLEKREGSLAAHRQHLAQSRELLRQGPLDLLVWPETAYPVALRGPLPLAGHLVRGDLDVPLLFGAQLVANAGGRKLTSNAALLVEADGMIRRAYRKNLLIPLAEWIPLASLLPELRARLPHAQDFLAAADTPALQLGPWRISTPICYEAVRPEFVRRMVTSASPHLLVTLANDAWFGDSREPRMHLQLARLRAVEHRRYLVRATNSGISAIVDPLGRVVARTGILSRENLRGVVRPLEGRTPYDVAGDWVGAASAIVVALALVSPLRRPRARAWPSRR